MGRLLLDLALVCFVLQVIFSSCKQTERGDELLVVGGQIKEAHGFEVERVGRWRHSGGVEPGWDRALSCGTDDDEEESIVDMDATGDGFLTLCDYQIKNTKRVGFFDGETWILVTNYPQFTGSPYDDGCGVYCEGEGSCFVLGFFDSVFNTNNTLNSFAHFVQNEFGEWNLENDVEFADLDANPDSGIYDGEYIVSNSLKRYECESGEVFRFFLDGDEGTEIWRGGDTAVNGTGGWELFATTGSIGMEFMHGYDISSEGTMIVVGESDDSPTTTEAYYITSDILCDGSIANETFWEPLYKGRDKDHTEMELYKVAIVDESSRYFLGIFDEQTDDGGVSLWAILYSEEDAIPEIVNDPLTYVGNEIEYDLASIFLIDEVLHLVGVFYENGLNYNEEDDRHYDNAFGLVYWNSDNGRWQSLGGGFNNYLYDAESHPVAYAVDDEFIWVAHNYVSDVFDVTANSLIAEVQNDFFHQPGVPRPWFSLGRRRIDHDTENPQYLHADVLPKNSNDTYDIYVIGIFDYIGPYGPFGSIALFQFDGDLDEIESAADVDKDEYWQYLTVGGGLWMRETEGLGEFSFETTTVGGLVKHLERYDSNSDGEDDLLFAGGRFNLNSEGDKLCNIAYLDISDRHYEGNGVWQNLMGGCNVVLSRVRGSRQSVVSDFLVWKGFLYVVGDFRWCGNTEVNGFGRLHVKNGIKEGRRWEAIAPGGFYNGFPEGVAEEAVPFYTIAQHKELLWIGGSFSYVGNMLVNGLVTWNPQYGFRVPLTSCNEDGDAKCANEAQFNQAATPFQPEFCTDFDFRGSKVFARCVHPYYTYIYQDGVVLLPMQFDMNEDDPFRVQGSWTVLGMFPNFQASYYHYGQQLVHNGTRIATATSSFDGVSDLLLVYEGTTHGVSLDTLYLSGGYFDDEDIRFMAYEESAASSLSGFLHFIF